MHKYFAEDTGQQRIFLLHGLGGAGKTQIALKFIEESSHSLSARFSDVFLIDSSTPDTIDTGFMNIAVSKNFGRNAQDALQWISNTSDGWLLIFDNADDPKINLHNYFPRCKHGNILITSRNPALAVHAGAHTVVSDMEETDSVELLLKSAAQDSTPQNQEVATEIVKVSLSFPNLKLISIPNMFQELCYFPLAIIQAGAFISKSGALDSYLALYSANRVRLLSEKPTQTHDDYASTVYTTWQISFEQLTPPAATLLQLCSFLHHQGISEKIFSNAAMYNFPANGPSKAELEGPLGILSQCMDTAGCWDSLQFMDLINQLRAYSLISFDPVTKMFSIHPLVHKWSQSTLTDQRGYHLNMVAIVGMSFQAFTEETIYVASQQLLAHVDSLLQGDTAIAVDFGLEYAAIYMHAGQNQKAEPLQLAVLQRRSEILGEDHLDTLTAMEYVAETYNRLGRLQDAEALQNVFFEKRRTILGENHPDTLFAMSNLAKTYHQQGRLQQAEALQIVVLEKRRTILGRDHPHTLTAMVHLAGTYCRLGRMQEAQALQVVVLEKHRTTLGEGHPETLTIMNNLALTHFGLGQLHEAEALQIVVLEKHRTTLGEEHPETLTIMNNLALTYFDLGRLQEAAALQIVVLEKYRRILGEEHQRTLAIMNNLALTYSSLGQLQEAETLQIVVLEKRKAILGEDHPDTLRAMGNLTQTYHQLGRLQEAEALQRVIIEKQQTISGDDTLNR
ncbi:hypothetical protein C8R44DRAFT_715624 [Mycena epipterygia]|nr:hypothetical protein C8R44DRAFT_715624 [Mycena epipterygia]